MTKDRAILLLNLGGPERLDEVKDFLYRLFSDPEIIRIKFSPLRKLIAWLLATTREKKSQNLYRQVGGGSPIHRFTDQQALFLEEKLEKEGLHASVRTAFTCSKPLVEDVMKELRASGIQLFLAFPQYPQYSFTTTKSALDRVRRAVESGASGSRLFEIRSWPTHPLFIQAHSNLILKEFQKVKDQNQESTSLVFSAHSIPEKLVTKEGDPYRDEMVQSAEAIVKKAQWKGPWMLAWQSKLGPVKWLEPATSDVIVDLGKKRCKKVILDPIAFTTDHIETLEELDGEIARLAKENGIEEFYRVPGLNSDPTFIDCLVDIAKSQKDFWAAN